MDHVTAQLFTVRRIYFDAIVAGTKTREVRRLSDFWRKNAARILESVSRFGWAEGVFECGHDIHRRKIMGIGWCDTPEDALGREPSEQGRIDLGYGPVVYFDLGEELHVA